MHSPSCSPHFTLISIPTALYSMPRYCPVHSENNQKLECGPMPNVMAALPNIDGALCSTSQSLARAHCSTAVQKRCQQESARLGERKVNFAPGKIPLRSNSHRKCIYSLPAQVRAKHCAKFAWLPLSNVASVTKPRRESR